MCTNINNVSACYFFLKNPATTEIYTNLTLFPYPTLFRSEAAVEADLAHLKELIEKSNPEVMSEGEVADIKAAKEKLMTGAQSLFAKLYEQAGGAQGAGPDMGAQDAGSYQQADDVVDGDYREV